MHDSNLKPPGFLRGELNIEKVLPHLEILHRRGMLVPFIGSGMSFPECTLWVKFIGQLAAEAGLDSELLPTDLDSAPSSVLYRLAENVVTALRVFSPEDRAVRYRRALRPHKTDEGAEIPPQMKALGSVYWPLVLTTNYDDLYLSSAERWHGSVCGRSREDCHRVLRSLDESHETLIWALQGFIGGQAKPAEFFIPDPRRRNVLLNQVVVGHQQYQQAINAELHFRRAFAEVFRHRSLIFMGSGLQEDYFVNLFSEIVHHNGLGANPHFALISKDGRQQIDPWFLEVRLGIVPVFYDSHNHLPELLKKLSGAVRATPWEHAGNSIASSAARCQLGALSYRMTPSGVPSEELEVQLMNIQMRLPDDRINDASLVSVGRSEKNEPKRGRQAESYLDAARKGGMLKGSDNCWVPLDESPSYVFRLGKSSVFAVAARRRDLKGEHDIRDLTIIPEAVEAALKAIEAAAFSTVLVGAVASGKGSGLHPLHTFAQTLRGLRLFATRSWRRKLRRISLSIVDPRVWSPLLAGKLAVQELLSSDLMTYRLDVEDGEGHLEHIHATLAGSPTAAELMEHCRFDSKKWRFTLFPKPSDKDNSALPPDITVVATVTMTLTPKEIVISS